MLFWAKWRQTRESLPLCRFVQGQGLAASPAISLRAYAAPLLEHSLFGTVSTFIRGCTEDGVLAIVVAVRWHGAADHE